MSQLLGGLAGPIGWSVQFLDAPADEVLAAVLRIRGRWDTATSTSAPRPYPEVLEDLAPLEAPWTRELIVACGSWTAYLNNAIYGGDPTAIGPVVAVDLSTRLIMAENTPRYGPGHQATQLWISGPDGQPPLMYERTLAAHSTDGRWSWEESGTPLPFEDISRYRQRRIRSRLDRPLLVHYLAALDITVDDNSTFGNGVIVQQHVNGHRRELALEDARRELGTANSEQ